MRQHELLPWLRLSSLLQSGLPWSAVCSISWRCVVVGHVPSCPAHTHTQTCHASSSCSGPVCNVMLCIINPAACHAPRLVMTLVPASGKMLVACIHSQSSTPALLLWCGLHGHGPLMMLCWGAADVGAAVT